MTAGGPTGEAARAGAGEPSSPWAPIPRLQRLFRRDGLPLRPKQALHFAEALSQRGPPAAQRALYLKALRGLGLDARTSAAAPLSGPLRPYLAALAAAGLPLDGLLGVHELWTAAALRALQRAWRRDGGPPWRPEHEDALLHATVLSLGPAALEAQRRFAALPRPDQRSRLGPLLPPGAELGPLRAAYLQQLGAPAARSVVGAVELLLRGELLRPLPGGLQPEQLVGLPSPATFSLTELLEPRVEGAPRAGLGRPALGPSGAPAPVGGPGALDDDSDDPDEAQAGPLLEALHGGSPGDRPCFPLADAILLLLHRSLQRPAPPAPPRPPCRAAAPALAPSDRAQAWAAVAEAGPLDLAGWLGVAEAGSADDPVVRAALAHFDAAPAGPAQAEAWERLAAALARRHLGAALAALRAAHAPEVERGRPAQPQLEARWLQEPGPYHPPERRARATQRFRLDLGRSGTDRRLASALWATLGTPAAQLAWLLREWTASERALAHLHAILPPEAGGEVVPLLRALLAPDQAASGFSSAVSRVGEAAWALVALDLALERSRPPATPLRRWRLRHAEALRSSPEPKPEAPA